MSAKANRRSFITLLGGAAAWPLAARAQQSERMRRIIVLMGIANDTEAQARAVALRQGLQALGWTIGRNIQIDYSFADGDAERMNEQPARVHHAARRRGDVAGCGACAAGGQATDHWVSGRGCIELGSMDGCLCGANA